MKTTRFFLILAAVTLFSECSAYSILGVFPLNAKSHNILFEALMKGLAKHGHQVDVISHFPLKKPVKNYNDIIDLSGSMENLMNNYTIDLVKNITSIDVATLVVDRYGDRLCDFMGLETMQRLIKNPPKNPPYDVVITEAFAANCYMGLGHVFNAPVIAVASCAEFPWVTHFIGNDDNLAYVPNALYIGTSKMTYWERVTNVISNYRGLWTFQTLTEKSQTELMRKYLSPDIPNIRDVEKNVALTLVNNHPIIFGVKPITPSLVQIAGLHVEQNDEKLTPELQKWMDESIHGVVYFTFGSMVLIETLPAEQLKEIYTSFEKIAPVRVLMKIVNKSKLPPGLPKNVKILPWIPQIPLLAHPNVKVFITHGGLGGLQEALYFGVPTIGVPLFGDQNLNCEAFAAKKTMVLIDFDKLSGKVLDSALDAVILNPIYKKNAVYYSKLFRDQPISQTNNAVFWIEYVIRNGPVLRSPALDFTWWQLALLDVYALIFLVLILGLAIVLYSINLFINTILKLLKSNSLSTKQKLKKS